MGLINCFGDHIPHLADERRLLRQMEKEKKSKKTSLDGATAQVVQQGERDCQRNAGIVFLEK